ncbi:hypothetical protein POTOM_040505 [Populus tomentosa]|uniref:Uncharacterized protein n=1 Tax=Populus tomentosa TaxID=118781 RepID=A0A8X7YQ22_POPTO|nr:hypothetical protein POTOM_040505 [Populus tomentosa]
MYSTCDSYQVAAHERRLSSLFTVEPGLPQCWTCCRRGADEDKLARLSVPGERNKHGQGAVDTSLGFAKERGMPGLSLAKKGRLAERRNGDQREREKKGAEMAS